MRERDGSRSTEGKTQKLVSIILPSVLFLQGKEIKELQCLIQRFFWFND